MRRILRSPQSLELLDRRNCLVDFDIQYSFYHSIGV